MKEKISEIKEELKQTAPEDMAAFIARHEADPREGAARIVQSARRKLAAYQKEEDRVYSMLAYERRYAGEGPICGIDEAGRGPLAGPVVAAAVILKPEDPIFYVNDSKKLSAARREKLFEEIMDRAAGVGVGIADAARIDQINILQADYEAMREAAGSLPLAPSLALNDAVTIQELGIRQIPIIHGDALSLSIAAASIIAKVTRDRMMMEYDRIYPEYGFASHKGYGTAQHIKALQTYGPCPIHRRSFITHFI